MTGIRGGAIVWSASIGGAQRCTGVTGVRWLIIWARSLQKQKRI